MNKSARTWLIFMMVPFFVGILIHFLVPLEIIITANPKLQQAYNGYKIEVEQNTVRALAFLNSRVITNRIQMYENIRSTLMRLYEKADALETLNNIDYELLSAYELANSNMTAKAIYDASMWYSPNFTSTDNMTDTAKHIYSSYALLQPYLKSIYSSNDEIYLGVVNLQMILNYQGYEFDFRYPSTLQTRFSTTNNSVQTSCYTKTIANYRKDGNLMTIFDLGSVMRMCTVIILGNDTQIVNGTIITTPRGVVCIGLDIEIVIRDITSVLGVPEFELSTNEYYLVRPLYSSENQVYPQIIAHFSSNNLSQIDITLNATFSLKQNPLPSKIFYLKNANYSMNIQRHEKTKTFYTIPIICTNYDDSGQVVFFLVVLNNFAKAELAQQSRNQKIAVIMIVPSVSLLIISIIATSFILRSILKKLDNALGLMGEYCMLIKNGDLKLEIPEYDDTQDLKELFVELQKLNQLSKYSDIQYFRVPKPERIIRFLKCVKLFDELGYNKTNLYENIAQCYMSIGQFESALKYLRLSIQMTIKDMYGNQEIIEQNYQQKMNKKITKIDRASLKRDKIIKRKILKLCSILHAMNTTSGSKCPQNVTLLAQRSQLVRKITYPDILNVQYISCLFFIVSCSLQSGNFEEVERKLEIIYELIQGYEQFHQGNRNCEYPADLLLSSWYQIKGSVNLAKKNYVEAFALFVKALQGNHFNPEIHTKIHERLQIILELHGISKHQLHNFKYIQQYKPRIDREFIFLVDVGKPNMTVQKVNEWKKHARRVSEHIFNNFIKDNDRISIIEYCLDIKIVCNLMEKGNRQKILKKQLMSSIKARDQSINGLTIPSLRKTIERVKNLKKQKVFIILLKDGVQISGDEIYEEIRQVENAIFMFFIEDPSKIKDKNQQFYVMNYDSEIDIKRVLQQKVHKQADNIIYIL